MSATDWDIGQRVRFVREYRLPMPSEEAGEVVVAAGNEGDVVEVFDDSIWVRVDGREVPVTLWFPHAFPDDFAKITVLERV